MGGGLGVSKNTISQTARWAELHKARTESDHEARQLGVAQYKSHVRKPKFPTLREQNFRDYRTIGPVVAHELKTCRMYDAIYVIIIYIWKEAPEFTSPPPATTTHPPTYHRRKPLPSAPAHPPRPRARRNRQQRSYPPTPRDIRCETHRRPPKADRQAHRLLLTL